MFKIWEVHGFVFFYLQKTGPLLVSVLHGNCIEYVFLLYINLLFLYSFYVIIVKLNLQTC